MILDFLFKCQLSFRFSNIMTTVIPDQREVFTDSINELKQHENR